MTTSLARAHCWAGAISLMWGVMACAAAPPSGDWVPLRIQEPKPTYAQWKPIKPAPTLEPRSAAPRPAFFVPPGTVNLAAKKPVTSSDSAPVIGELAMITDGNAAGSDGSFVELARGKQWVQIDLGAPAEIHALVVWRWNAENRVYHDVVIQVADDAAMAKNVRTVFNNDFDDSSGLGVGKNLEYFDDYRGKLIDAKNDKGQPVRGRYVRLYSHGNTSNDLNHYVEVEVYGKLAE